MNFIIAGCHCCRSFFYCISGYTTSAVRISDVDRYAVGPDSWSAATSISSPSRTRHSIASIDSTIYTFMGDSTSAIKDVDSFSANTWSAKTDAAVAKQGTICGVVDALAYVFGGWTGSTNYSDNEEYDPLGDSFATKSSLPSPSNRIDSSGCTVDGEVYSFGGGLSTALSDVDAYLPSGNSWSAKSSLPETRTNRPAAFTIGASGYVCGGQTPSGSPYKTARKYDSDGDSWSSITDMGVGCITTAGASDGVSSGFVFSGSTGGGTFIKTTQVYSESGNSWSTGADIPDPGRGYHGVGSI